MAYLPVFGEIQFIAVPRLAELCDRCVLSFVRSVCEQDNSHDHVNGRRPNMAGMARG